MNQKRVMSMDELFEFCQRNNYRLFSSKEAGFSLAVSIPATFEVVEEDEDLSRRGLVRLRFRVCHIGQNRNKTYISEENMKKAMPSLKDRPILATIHQLDDGSWDFHKHDMYEDPDEETTEYIEKQVGNFTEDDPFLEYDEELDKTFVVAYGVIPEEYTKAASVIRANGGAKNSCELCVDSFTYNAKEGCLEIQDFYFSGSTLLGKEKDGTEIKEGMIGSRADIVDFTENQDNSCFHIQNLKEGGQSMTKMDELLRKYNKSLEDITFEHDGLTDAELEAKFAEMFDGDGEGGQSGEGGETQQGGEEGNGSGSSSNNGGALADNGEQTGSEEGGSGGDSGGSGSNDSGSGSGSNDSGSGSGGNDSGSGSGGNDSGSGSGSNDSGTNPVVTPTSSDDPTPKKKTLNSFMVGSVTYELSLGEKEIALYRLVNATYADADNTWYGVRAYESYVIMEDWCTGQFYRQNYTEDGDEFALIGDRVKVYSVFVTEEERAELDSMRANYAELVSFKENADLEAIRAQKLASVNDEKYAVIKSEKAYKDLVKNIDNYSLADFEKEVKLVLFDYREKHPIDASHKVNFDLTEQPKKKKAYGNLFD